MVQFCHTDCMADRHMLVCNFSHCTGPDYGFHQPFCLQRNNKIETLKSHKIYQI